MKRCVLILGVCLGSLSLFGGCGVKELGPMDESQVKKEDPETIRRGMETSAKHLPPGVKPPAHAFPQGGTGTGTGNSTIRNSNG
jgi:hypothetical protein